MIRRPPRSTLDRSSAASDVYKRQVILLRQLQALLRVLLGSLQVVPFVADASQAKIGAVSYTHLRAHETVLDLVCRLLLEQKNTYYINAHI